MIGINTAIYSPSGAYAGIGFAVPSNLARHVYGQLKQHGRVIRGWLGITGQNLTNALAESLGIPMRAGILVSGVLEDGPADQADIRPGDLIIALDRKPVQDSQDMLNAVAGKPPEMFNVDASRYDEMRPGCYDVHERVRDMNAGGQLAGELQPRLPDGLFRGDQRELGEAVIERVGLRSRGVVVPAELGRVMCAQTGEQLVQPGIIVGSLPVAQGHAH